MTLSVVPPLPGRDHHHDDFGDELRDPICAVVRPEPYGLPTFEGEIIEELRGKMTATAHLEMGDKPHHLDDSVRLLVTARVQRVDHVIDDRTGKLTRIETFKVVEAVEVPWALAGALLLDDDELHQEIYGDGGDEE